jgi:hypothetical protein
VRLFCRMNSVEAFSSALVSRLRMIDEHSERDGDG